MKSHSKVISFVSRQHGVRQETQVTACCCVCRQGLIFLLSSGSQNIFANFGVFFPCPANSSEKLLQTGISLAQEVGESFPHFLGVRYRQPRIGMVTHNLPVCLDVRECVNSLLFGFFFFSVL